jgi:hypothetical protein
MIALARDWSHHKITELDGNTDAQILLLFQANAQLWVEAGASCNVQAMAIVASEPALSVS